ncbi:hypothetical protein KA093_01655 [Candidatus Saccharibacteria bacterium]|nr:hypothetical protein [Candidatus Saccharibacteria bacterium]
MSQQPERLINQRDIAAHQFLNAHYEAASNAYAIVGRDTSPWSIERPEIPHMLAMAAATSLLFNHRDHISVEAYYKQALQLADTNVQKAEIWLERATAAEISGLPKMFVKESLFRALRILSDESNNAFVQSLRDIATIRIAQL